MKALFKLIILVQFIWIGNASALSCKIPDLKFVVKCQNDICVEGFFLFLKSRGSGCSTMLDIKTSDLIYKLSSDFSSIKSNSEILNGFYKLPLKKDLYIKRDYLNYSKCFSENSQNIISTDCFNKGTEFIPLDYKNQESTEFVKNAFVEKSEFESLKIQIMKIIFPIIMLIFIGLSIWYNDSKHIGKILTAIFILILAAAPDMLLSGWISWLRTGFYGLIYFIGFIIFLFIRSIWRYYLRKKNN